MEWGEPSDPEGPEKPSKVEVFEHLFPGNKFKDLSFFNPLNGPAIYKYRLWDGVSMVDEIAQAIRLQQGYAKRQDFPMMDQLWMSSVLPGITPSQENSQALRGWFAELLKEGERVGGMGFRPISFIPKERWQMVTALQRNPLKWVDALGNPDLYQTVTARVVGILDDKSKPRALITFVQGPRSNREKGKVPSRSLVPKLSTG